METDSWLCLRNRKANFDLKSKCWFMTGGEAVDHTSSWHAAFGQNGEVRTGNLLLFRR